MPYSEEQARQLEEQCESTWLDLLKLHVRFDREANGFDDEHGKEFLKYGVGRRFHLMGYALRNIYRIFPPGRAANLGQQELADVQLNLHAFVINLAGSFDNMAWAFVLRHGLLQQVGGRMGVGMFVPATRRFLPQDIRDNLDTPEARAWQQTYLKDYRDALAHRIPLYLPPAVFAPGDGERFNALEQQKFDALRTGHFERIEAFDEEQAQIGRPCFAFMHSFGPTEPSRAIAFHPQLLSDTRTMVDFGSLFLEHWHERAP